MIIKRIQSSTRVLFELEKRKIIDEKKLSKFKMDYMLVLIWHFKNYVIKKIKSANKSIKIIVPFPKIKII